MGIDGLLIVDKPEGLTSLDVVRQVKRQLGAKRAGHIGTLDPFATGVLPIAIDEGTKLIPFINDEPKEYEATLKLGEETATDDLTGKVISSRGWENLSLEVIRSSFQIFLGRIRQIPPMFSAVKREGKPLYLLARRGMEVERSERELEIFSLQIGAIDLPKVRFKVSCSKGTYIRALARDIGKEIGCGAHLIQLRRVRSGPFTLEQAVSWEELKGRLPESGSFSGLIPLEAALPGLPEFMCDEHLIRKVRHGREIVVRDLSAQALPSFEKGQWLKITSSQEGLVAIVRTEVGGAEIANASPERVAFRPVRVFQPNGALRAKPVVPKRCVQGANLPYQRSSSPTGKNPCLPAGRPGPVGSGQKVPQ
ncbi:MAG: tRNA pseudouridine(55) synthase TruB [Thermodesulfobacteriota bacterium]